MNWKKPNLNAQKNYLALTLSLQLLSPLLFYVCFCCCCWGFFAFLFHLLFPLSLMLIIGILYCLNYTLLLLHLITTHLVSHLSLLSIVFIISMLNIFYCLNYTSLLLHLFITHLVIDFISMRLTYVLGNYYDLYKCH